VLSRLARGEAIGTELQAQTGQLTARKQWMADHLHTAGAVEVQMLYVTFLGATFPRA